jgi:hypothetical protein
MYKVINLAFYSPGVKEDRYEPNLNVHGIFQCTPTARMLFQIHRLLVSELAVNIIIHGPHRKSPRDEQKVRRGRSSETSVLPHHSQSNNLPY